MYFGSLSGKADSAGYETNEIRLKEGRFHQSDERITG